MNLCSLCHRDFSSVEAFHGHAGRRFDVPTTHTGSHRCMTEAELVAKGFAVDERGRWCVVQRQDAEEIASRAGRLALTR